MSEIGLVPVQVISFLWSIALGAGLGVLYDCFRIVRLAFPSPTPLVAVQDVIFGLMASILSFGYLLTVSDGRLRFFLLVGEALGWALYYATVGEFVMALSGIIIGAISTVVRLVWRIIAALLIFVWRIVSFFHRVLSCVLIAPLKSLAGWLQKLFFAVCLRGVSGVGAIKTKIKTRFRPKKDPKYEKKLKTT